MRRRKRFWTRPARPPLGPSLPAPRHGQTRPGGRPVLRLLSAGSLLASCAPETQETPTPAPVETVAHEIFDGPTAETLEISAPSTVPLLKASGGDVYLGTDSGLYRLEEDGAVPVEYLPQAGEPGTTGAIQVLARRESGLLVVAEQGIFHTYGQNLLYSPLSAAFTGQTIHDVAVSTEASGSGNDTTEVVWVATAEGLFRATPEALEQVQLPVETTAATAVSALPDPASNGDTRVWVAFAEGLFELEGESWHGVAAPATVERFFTWEDTLYAATDAGLLVRPPGGGWQLHQGENASPLKVAGIGVDAAGQALFSADAGVLRLDGGDPAAPLTRLATAEQVGPQPPLALDVFGNIWLGSDTGVTGLMVGSPLSFAARVSPIFEMRCNACHLGGASAPAHDFTRWEEVEPMIETILQRVYTGQMPSTGPLPIEESDVIVQWDESGRNP